MTTATTAAAAAATTATTAAATFAELSALADQFFITGNPMPVFCRCVGETWEEIAERVYKRCQATLWESSLINPREWESGEKECLQALFEHLTGETINEKNERIEMLYQRALIVIRDYQGTRLWGALKRAGLGEILEPHMNMVLDEAIFEAKNY